MDVIDVSVDIEISAAPADVAGVMFDPARDSEWLQVVTGVELIDPALAPGARVRRTGTVLGRDVSWTTEVERVHFPHLLTLRVTEGPVLGRVRYEIQRSVTGSTVRIRGVSDEGQLGSIPAAFIEGPLRTLLSADLERLKAIVEKPA